MEKTLSIIIPTYNMEMYLSRCIDSLIKKESIIQYLEIIIVNDGSKDQSLKIALNYQNKHPLSIQVIDKENGNYGSCINAALKIATAKYIRVIDADDWVDSSELSIFLEKLKNMESDLIITNYSKVYPNGNKTIISFNLKEGYSYKINEALPLLQLKDFQMHSITYRTEILKGYTQTEGISYTDQEWIFYPILNVEKVMYIKQNVYQYFLGREGQTMELQIMIKRISQQIKIVEKMMEWYSNYPKLINKNIEKEKYFTDRLIMLLSSIYKIILLTADNEDTSLLNTLDKKLKNTLPLIYTKLNEAVIHHKFPYHFTKTYHQNGKRPNFIIRLLYKKFLRLKASGLIK